MSNEHDELADAHREADLLREMMASPLSG